MRLGAVTLADAERMNIELKSANHDPSVIKDTMDNMTWKDVRTKFDRYLEIENRGSQYRKDCHSYLKKMADYWTDNIDIKTITRQHVMNFRLTLRDRGLSEASCNRYIATGKAAVTVFDPDMANPFHIKFYNETERITNTTKFLTSEQREKLLEVSQSVSQSLYEIVFVALFTGWRKTEILLLRRDSVDWINKYATVQQKRGRIIHRPISQKVYDLLMSVEDNGTPYFWISKKTGQPYNRDWKYPWMEALRRAGITGFRFHDMRHDFAIRVYGTTGSQRTVQDLLGHHQISTTQRYVKVLPENLRVAVDSI